MFLKSNLSPRPSALPSEPCEICQYRPAILFLIVTQDDLLAKAHACTTCWENISRDYPVEVESVSLQEFKQFPDGPASPNN